MSLSRKSDKKPRQLEARIVIRPGPDGRREVFCFDPQTGREIRVHDGLHPREVNGRVRSLKEQLERAGNYVVVKEM